MFDLSQMILLEWSSWVW